MLIINEEGMSEMAEIMNFENISVDQIEEVQDKQELLFYGYSRHGNQIDLQDNLQNGEQNILILPIQVNGRFHFSFRKKFFILYYKIKW